MPNPYQRIISSLLRWVCVLFMFGCPSWALGQKGKNKAAMNEVRAWIDSLCSENMAGRGYVYDGHKKAAYFLEREFKRMGMLRPPGLEGYFQPFDMNINLPTLAKISIDEKKLEIGRKAILNRLSGSGRGEFEIIDEAYGLYPNNEVRGKVVIFRDGWPEHLRKDKKKQAEFGERKQDLYRVLSYMEYQPAGVIIVKNKLTAGFAKQALPFPVVEVLAEALPERPVKVKWEITSLVTEVQSQNVLGYYPGTSMPDSTLIICAHYDHLGQLENAIFTGANDNASGVAMLLKLGTHFAKNPYKYSLLFIAFGGEEAGLAGSEYYVMRQPVLPLDSTYFVLNLDLMGNGDEGMTAVAGYENEKFWQKLVDINEKVKAVPKISRRRNRPNSDHFFFVEKGVPSLFLFTLGGLPHYHDVNDRPEVLTLEKFQDVYNLLLAWINVL